MTAQNRPKRSLENHETSFLFSVPDFAVVKLPVWVLDDLRPQGTGRGSHLVIGTPVQDMPETLDDDRFLHSHRLYITNLDHVLTVQRQAERHPADLSIIFSAKTGRFSNPRPYRR